jgi:hypothetical protein
MRIVLAIAMALHGVAHLVGFAESWQLAATSPAPFKTTVLGGRVDLGLVGIRAGGVLWLLAAVMFCVVAVATVVNTDWWASTALATAVASIVLSAIWWPEARVGIAVNAVLITVLLAGRHFRFI